MRKRPGMVFGLILAPRGTRRNTVHIGFDNDAGSRANPPVPPFGKGGRRGDLFGKGGRGLPAPSEAPACAVHLSAACLSLHADRSRGDRQAQTGGRQGGLCRKYTLSCWTGGLHRILSSQSIKEIMWAGPGSVCSFLAGRTPEAPVTAEIETVRELDAQNSWSWMAPETEAGTLVAFLDIKNSCGLIAFPGQVDIN